MLQREKKEETDVSGYERASSRRDSQFVAVSLDHNGERMVP